MFPLVKRLCSASRVARHEVPYGICVADCLCHTIHHLRNVSTPHSRVQFDYKKLDGLDAAEVDSHPIPAFGQAAGRLIFPATSSATVATSSPSPGAQSQVMEVEAST